MRPLCRSMQILLSWMLINFAILDGSQDIFAEHSGLIDESYMIRSVQVQGGWLSDFEPPFSLPIAYSDELVEQAMEKARKDFNQRQEKLIKLMGGASANTLYMTRTLKVQNKNVDLIIRILYLGVTQIEGTDVTVPYTEIPPILDKIPESVLEFAPQVAVHHDRTTGASAKLAISKDVFSWLESKPQDQNLHVELEGSKSFERDFYSGQGFLSYQKEFKDDLWRSWSLRNELSGSLAPFSYNRLEKFQWRAGSTGYLQPNLGIIQDIHMSGFYRYMETEFDHNSGAITEDGDIHQLDLSLISQGWIDDSIARMGLWSESGFTENQHDNNYQKIAIKVGWGHDFSMPYDSNQTLGIKLSLGAGYSPHNLPDNVGFYGGNNQNHFLDSSIDSHHLSRMPKGPLFRSVGQSQLTARNSSGVEITASSYWNLNLDAAIPLPFAYFPLIPNETVDEQTTLKQLVASGVRSAESFTALSLASKHPNWSEQRVKEEARKMMSDVRPGVDYIVYKANVYAIKPLFLLDVASMGGANFSNQDIRLAVGGGLQLSIMNAQFEVGYMNTVIGLSSDQEDNIFANLSFRTLF